MYLYRHIWLRLAYGAALSAAPLHAGTANPPAGTPAAAPPPAPEEAPTNGLSGGWGGARDRLRDQGFDFSAVYINEVLANPWGGNNGHGVIDDGLLNVGVDVDLEKAAGWQGASFHVNGYWIHGSSLTDRYVGDFDMISNIEALDTVRLDEAWFQQNFLGDRVSIRAGQLAADGEFFSSEYESVFINGTFGAFSLIANNLAPYSPPVYPLAAPGVRLKIEPSDQTYFQAGVYDGDTGTQTENAHGVRYAFNGTEGLLVLSEAGYLLNQGKEDRGLPGTYKAGAWVHTADFDTWSSQAAFANGTGPLQGHGVNFGVYGVIDQVLWRSGPRALGLFLRGGGAPSAVNEVDFYIDGGLNLKAPFAWRKDDVAGLALARSSISRDFSRASVAQGGPAYDAESLVEATYSFALGPWWTVQPDLQYVFSAGGSTEASDALVIGVRSTVAF